MRSLPKPAVLRYLLVPALAGLLCGCAASSRAPVSDPVLPELDVLQVKESSEEALKVSNENKLEIHSLNAKVQELEERLALLRDQLAASLAGRMEVQDRRTDTLAYRVAVLDSAWRFSGRPAPAGPRSDPSRALPAPLVPGVKPLHPPAPAAALPPTSDNREALAYRQAFQSLHAKKHVEALARFEEIVRRFPASPYADNSVYWTGETHFAMGNIAKAMDAFRRIPAYARTEKADDAQMKLGYCYLRLGDRKRAAEEFRKLVSLYPDSEYGERAKEELLKLE